MPPNHVWFGCKKCHTFFPTLERGIQHLLYSAEHTSETIDLLDRYSDAYRDAAARTLISFNIHSDAEHDTAIAEAKHDALQQASGKRHIFQHSDTPPKRGRLDPAHIDVSPPRSHPRASTNAKQNSNRSQNVDNRSAVTNNVFNEPITVRVTVCPRATHAEDVFTFAFARGEHTTVEKLLQAVDESYRGRDGAAADLEALSSERFMMKLSKKNGAKIGGAVQGDRDVRDLSGVLGAGWFGEMEIG